MPATAPPLSPLSCAPAEAAEASDGCVPEDVTPLHRSAVAVRVEAAGAAVSAGADARLVLRDGVAARVGAVELADADWPDRSVTPAVAALMPVAALGVRAALGAVGRTALPVVTREGVGRADLTAPLVVADALCAGAWAGAVAATGAVAAAGAAAVAAAGPGSAAAGAACPAGAAGVAVDAGGAAGVAGVPKPEGVHAKATPTIATGALSSPTTASPAARVRRTTATASFVSGTYLRREATTMCLPHQGQNPCRRRALPSAYGSAP